MNKTFPSKEEVMKFLSSTKDHPLAYKIYGYKYDCVIGIKDRKEFSSASISNYRLLIVPDDMPEICLYVKVPDPSVGNSFDLVAVIELNAEERKMFIEDLDAKFEDDAYRRKEEIYLKQFVKYIEDKFPNFRDLHDLEEPLFVSTDGEEIPL